MAPRRRAMFAPDQQTMAQAFAAPGMDPRMWVSYGTVLADTPDVKSVDFDLMDDVGTPLVSVQLHPSGTEVPCRVAAAVAGNGEGEWFPFIGGDEVIVAVPSGDERAGCVIIGRLNNQSDKWPTQVNSNDATKNNFGFRRLRTPYVVETAASYAIRNATTGALLSMTPAGAIVMRDAHSTLFQMRPDIVGLRLNDGMTRIEIDVSSSPLGASIDMTAGNTINIVAGSGLVLSAGLATPAYHPTSVESVAVMLQAILLQFGVFAGGEVFGSVIAAAALAMVSAGLSTAVGLPVTPFTGVITTGLTVPTDPTGQKPGLGAGGILLGQ